MSIRITEEQLRSLTEHDTELRPITKAAVFTVEMSGDDISMLLAAVRATHTQLRFNTSERSKEMTEHLDELSTKLWQIIAARSSAETKKAPPQKWDWTAKEP